MKKTIVLTLSAALLIIACNKKSVPSSSQTSSTNKTEVKKEETKTTTTVQSSAAVTSPVANTQSPSNTDVTADLINQGKMVYNSKCTRCHGAKDPGSFTSSRWDDILKQMVPKAKLSSDEEKEVTAYVKANAKQ